MDLEGNLILDRKPARRWVTAIAVMIPVVACVAGVTWFVRAFISPPTVAIPGPMMLAATPPAPPPALPARSELPSPKPESAWPAVMVPPASAASSYAPPTAATVGAAPPAASPFPPPQPARMATAPSALGDPVPEIPPPAAASAIKAPAMPIIGRIPMPRPRPPESVLAAMHAAVPTPHPRAAEEETAVAATANPFLRAEPAYNRHSAE